MNTQIDITPSNQAQYRPESQAGKPTHPSGKPQARTTERQRTKGSRAELPVWPVIIDACILRLSFQGSLYYYYNPVLFTYCTYTVVQGCLWERKKTHHLHMICVSCADVNYGAGLWDCWDFAGMSEVGRCCMVFLSVCLDGWAGWLAG